jgi:hemoglobin
MNQATDISSRADIERLVNHFYSSVRQDQILGPIFDDIARIDWDHHLPKMYAFWDRILFGTPGFQGNPLAVHLELATKTPLGAREFSRWVSLFRTSVAALFRGPVADEAMTRAERIAGVMQHHVGAAQTAGA